MPEPANPVTRLLALVDAIRAVPQGERGKTGLEVWPTIFGLPQGQAARVLTTFPMEGKHRGIMERLVEVQRGIDAAEQYIRSIEETGVNHDFYLEDVRPLRMIFGPVGLSQPWEWPQNLCKPELIRGLQHVAEFLNRRRRETVVPAEDLADLLATVDELARQIQEKKAEVPSELSSSCFDS